MFDLKKLATGATLALSMLAATSASAQQYLVKYAHNDPVSEISKGHVPALFFKQYVERESGGRVKVQIFPSGQLGGDQDMIQQIQGGTLEVAQVSMGGISNFAPELQVLDLPYMLPSDMVVEELVRGPLVGAVNEEFKGKLNNTNLVAMSNLARWRSFFTTNKQVKNANDLKGLKIRTIPSQLQQEFVRAVGANPVSIPFGEVYTGLATGMADGLKNSTNDMMEFAFVESARYGFVDQHTNLMGFFFVSDRWLKSLPADLQVIVKDGLIQTADLQTQFNKLRERKAVEEYQKAGGTLYFPTAEDMKTFEPARDHMVTWYTERYGKEWLTKLEGFVAEAEQKVKAKRAL